DTNDEGTQSDKSDTPDEGTQTDPADTNDEGTQTDPTDPKEEGNETDPKEPAGDKDTQNEPGHPGTDPGESPTSETPTSSPSQPAPTTQPSQVPATGATTQAPAAPNEIAEKDRGNAPVSAPANAAQAPEKLARTGASTALLALMASTLLAGGAVMLRTPPTA
ncbi:MAG: hypothetical protein Q4B10_07855, partial [Actinomycetaceae bacterium]|nr:hypothetical protein [Actinomycetaceae bacterium]